MLLEIDVVATSNSPRDLNRIFDLIAEPRTIRRVFTSDPMGQDIWCEVTGWGEDGPCPALAAPSEDSGDGVVLLVYGGDDGIRLRAADSPGNWDLANSGQWGEPCLMLDKDTPVEE